MSENSNKPEPSPKLKIDKKSERKEKSAKKGERLTVSRFFAIVIIILIVIALTGTGVFYLVIPQLNKKNQLCFGAYDKEKILFEQNSKMQTELAILAQQHPDLANSPDFFSQYQLWSQAYNNAVFRTAAEKMARQSDVRAPQKLVDRTIIDQGVYNDEDGNFSEAKYNETPNERKAAINRNVKNALPTSIIAGDQATLAVPQGEKDMAKEMASAVRTFEYIPIDHNVLPDDFARDYLAMDPALFRIVSLSRIASSDEKKLQDAKAALDEGKAWDDVQAEFSEARSDKAGGALGVLRLHTLQDLLSAEQLETLLQTPEGGWTEPMKTAAGSMILRVDKAAAEADPSDPATLSDVKRHILSKDSDTALPMMEEAAASIGKEALEDFDEAALAHHIDTVKTMPTPANVGRSQIMATLDATDPKGLLASAASDEKLMRTLYTEEPGFVTEPVKTGSSYVVVRILDAKDDFTQGQTVDLFYPYLSATSAQNDFYTTILGSDKHVSDFFNGFQKIFGGFAAPKEPDASSGDASDSDAPAAGQDAATT